MATVVDALLITLGLDSSGVDRGMNQAQERIKGGVKNIVSALSAPIMAAFAGFSTGEALSAYTERATDLDRLSQSLGMSMEALQGWQYAAEAAGAEAAEVGNFFRDLSDYIVDATTFDSGPFKDIAKELGISLKDAQGNIKATEDVTLELADAFQRIGSQKAVAFGMQMGLDPGMIALLQKGRAEIVGLIQAQKELGGYTKEDAEIASKAKVVFLTLGKSIEAATMPIARTVVPAITWLAERFVGVAKLMRENSQFIQISLGLVAAVVTARFIPSLYAMGAAGLKAMLPFAPLIALVAGLALIIDDLVAYINGGDSALAGLWSQFGTGEEILAFFKSTWNGLLAGFEKLRPLVSVVARFGATFAVFYAAKTAVGGVISVISGLGSAFSALRVVLATNPFAVLLTAAAAIIVYWDDIIAGAQRVGTVISSAFSQAAQTVKGIWDAIFTWFQEKFQWVIDAWNGISDIPGKIGDTVSGIGDSIAEGAKGAVDTVSGWGSDFAAWVSDGLGFGDDDNSAAAEAIPGAAYNSAVSNRTATVTKSTTINGGINITGATDPQASGKAVQSVLQSADKDMTFAVDTGVRQ